MRGDALRPAVTSSEIVRLIRLPIVRTFGTRFLVAAALGARDLPILFRVAHPLRGERSAERREGLRGPRAAANGPGIRLRAYSGSPCVGDPRLSALLCGDFRGASLHTPRAELATGHHWRAAV